MRREGRNIRLVGHKHVIHDQATEAPQDILTFKKVCKLKKHSSVNNLNREREREREMLCCYVSQM